MTMILARAFEKYPQSKAPFLYKQYAKWADIKPLSGLRLLHHVPLVQNTLLKIACLVSAGADVVVTNPSCVRACPEAIAMLAQDNIEFVIDMHSLKRESFDIHMDCAAELLDGFKPPLIGTVELTGTGDMLYRKSKPSFPVISIDRSLTKQLETVFGMAVSALLSLQHITRQAMTDKVWVIFGFGKIGRGIAYCCKRHGIRAIVVDITEEAKNKATELNIEYVDACDFLAVEAALNKSDVVITATGVASALSAYPKSWFQGKMLGNMGVLDEFGDQYAPDEIFNNKQAMNFVLEDPTPVEYVDPELFLHNEVALDLIHLPLACGVHDITQERDSMMIEQWCQYHQVERNDIESWFVQYR